MKYLFAICLLLAGVGKGWASFYADSSWDKLTCPQRCVSISTLVAIVKDYKKAAERQKRSMPYQAPESSYSTFTVVLMSVTMNKVYAVIKGTEAYTLSDFVTSGKFCEWRGEHDWEMGSCKKENKPLHESIDEFNQPYNYYHCKICNRNRLRIRVSKEVEEWER